MAQLSLKVNFFLNVYAGEGGVGVETRVSSPSPLLFGARLSWFAEAKALADWAHKLNGSLSPRG